MSKQPNVEELFKLFMRLRGGGYSVIAAVLIVGVVAFVSPDIARYIPGMGGGAPSSTSSTTPSPSSTPSSGSQDACQVVKIYDGDTMTLQCPGYNDQTKVRMYCIDTPEIAQKPWGYTARDHLRKIATDHVRVEQHDKDRYGRVVGEVFAGNVNLNLEQVRMGHAAVYEAYCKSVLYQQAQTEARQAKRGIWAEPGLHQTPWEYRASKR